MSKPPPFDRERIVLALKPRARWRMLARLVEGESFTISELASTAGVSYDTAVKHLSVLRDAGVVEAPRAKLYKLTPACRCDREAHTIDFGFLLARFKS